MTRTTRETRSSPLRFARSRTSSPSFARDSTSSSIRECINFPTIESERDAFDPRSIRSTLTRRRVRSRSARSVTASVVVRSIASRRVAVSRVGRRRAFHSPIASRVINHFISPGIARGPRIPSVRMNDRSPIQRTYKTPVTYTNTRCIVRHGRRRRRGCGRSVDRAHTPGGDSIVSPDSRIGTVLYGRIRDSCVPPSPGIEMNGGV